MNWLTSTRPAPLTNTVPVANGQSLTTPPNTAKNLTLTGSDVDGDPLTTTVTSSSSNGVLSGTAPSLVYTPTAGFTGVDSFTFTVHDGVATSASATISITVSVVPPPPGGSGSGSGGGGGGGGGCGLGGSAATLLLALGFGFRRRRG